MTYDRKVSEAAIIDGKSACTEERYEGVMEYLLVKDEEPRAGVQSQNDSSSVFLACQDYVFQAGMQDRRPAGLWSTRDWVSRCHEG